MKRKTFSALYREVVEREVGGRVTNGAMVDGVCQCVCVCVYPHLHMCVGGCVRCVYMCDSVCVCLCVHVHMHELDMCL